MKTKSLVAVLGAGVTLGLPLTAHAARCSDGRDSNDVTTPDPNNPNASTPHEETKPAEECIERDIYFMPGTLGVFFQPRSGKAFYGGGVQVAPFQWSRNNDRFGPSQGSFYLQVAILESPQSKGAMTMFEAGATASFERNSSRRYLIPYFGATIGGMTQREVGTGVYTYPLAGAHLYWHRNLMVDAEGGYHFPFQDVDRERGPRAQVTARFSLW